MLPSERTTKYVEALAREGNRFDHEKWLHRVREEEAKAKQAPMAVPADDCPPAAGGNVAEAPYCQIAATAPVGAPSNIRRVAKAIHRARQNSRGHDQTSRLNRRLAVVKDVWNDFQRRRARDAVYGYLEAVFDLVQQYVGRSRTKLLRRRAFEFAGLPRDTTADPFTAVIRCTSDPSVDRKTISRWARALRYVAKCLKHRTWLQTFMNEVGGVNACADRYARYFGRGTR